MPPNRFESEVESFLEGSHGDRTHIKRADHHTVTPLCGTLLLVPGRSGTVYKNWLAERGEDFRAGVRIATLDPFQGQQDRHRLGLLQGHNQRARRLSHRHTRRARPR